MQTIRFLPDRLNAEPVVLRGFTTPELGSAALIGLAVGGNETADGQWRSPYKRKNPPEAGSLKMVPEPGIEPGTRGFSIPCSTD